MAVHEAIEVRCGNESLPADLVVPDDPDGVVVIAYGSGRARHRPANLDVAASLEARGHATLSLDLLTGAEDERSPELRRDVELLASRVAAALQRLREDQATRGLPLGCFGVGTAAAAALLACARHRGRFRALVTATEKPGLADADALATVDAPTLLVVAGEDAEAVAAGREALHALTVDSALEVVPGSRDLSEPAARERLGEVAAEWFRAYFDPRRG